jgi:putative phosphonate transport system ATP-binding protein
MRHGQVVETGLTDQVLDDPQHPYTQLLVSSVLSA